MPLSDALVDPRDAAEPEPRYPLNVAFCPHCTLLQILDSPAPDVLFGSEFPYRSSSSPALLEHARQHALRLIGEFGLDANSLVVELGSNDGYLLKHVHELGVRVLGIDPVDKLCALARAAGVPSRCAFFDEDCARRLRDEGVEADVVIGNNVLAHVPDPDTMVAGAARLLRSGGAMRFEVPYVADLVEGNQFDTIYHEHHCYFSVSSLAALMARNALVLTAVEHLDIHGGSLRVTARPGRGAPPAAVRAWLDAEHDRGITGAGYYAGMQRRCDEIAAGLKTLLVDLKSAGKSVAAYGAAAKGAIMLNLAGIGTDLCEYVVDRNGFKHGKLMPGTRQPVRPVAALVEQRPDYVLLLAWNFAGEIMAQQSAYLAGGGRFIVPVPHPAIVG